MKKIASLALVLGNLLFGVSAISAELCPEAAQKASKLAQDYRKAVGKVRTACASTSDECNQRQAQADQTFALLDAANREMLLACLFTGPTIDDSLPVTTATVTDAIGVSLPDLVLLQFFSVDELNNVFVGGASGTTVATDVSDLVISSDTETWFTYTMTVNFTAAPDVFVDGERCQPFISGVIPIVGSAYFSAAEAGGTVNRLQVTVSQITSTITNYSGNCSTHLIPNVDANVTEGLELRTKEAIEGTLARRHCGAMGPELFGPCS